MKEDSGFVLRQRGRSDLCTILSLSTRNLTFAQHKRENTEITAEGHVKKPSNVRSVFTTVPIVGDHYFIGDSQRTYSISYDATTV